MNDENKLFKSYMDLEKELDDCKAENEELRGEIEHLEEQLEQEIQYRKDNFRMIPEMEMYGLHGEDFH